MRIPESYRGSPLAAAIAAILTFSQGTDALAQEQAQAQAQDQTKVIQGLEEIVVTAERREASQQSVPMAITTLSSDFLERQQVRNISALDQIVPNIVMNPNTGTSSASKIFLRGVGEDESFFTADTPVGIYVDDVYIARQTGAMFDLFDVERLEVLRGPQGTLYGRNTSAGALKLVTRKPRLDDFFGDVELTLGNYARHDLRGTLNVPMGSAVALQLGALTRNRNGYTYNRYDGQDVNDQDLQGYRASLLVQPNDQFNVLFVADHINEHSTPGYPVPLTLDANKDPLKKITPRTGDFFTTNSDLTDPLNDLKQTGLALTLTYAASDALTLKSITSYRKMDNLLLLDADGDVLLPQPSITGRFHLYQDQEQSQKSEELQALGNLFDNRLHYVAGLFFFRESNDQDTKSVIGFPPAAGGTPLSPDAALALASTARESMTTDSWAIYLSGTYDITDRLSATVGVRYTDESKKYSNHVLRANGTQSVVCLNPTGTAQVSPLPCTEAQLEAGDFTFVNASKFDESWNDVTPRFVLDYHLTDSALIYASAAKGFKGGTTSGRDTSAVRNYNRIVGDPETNWSYETGLKADWFERTLRTNLALFWNEYKGMQFGVATPDGGFGRINAGDATIKGAELEVTAVPVKGLELSGAFGALDGEYTKWSASLSTCAPQGITTEKQYLNLDLKQTPKWSYRLGANYSYDAGGLGVFSVGADYSAKDDHYNNLCNSEGIRVTDYEFVNAALRWQSAPGNVELALSGTNLTNSKVLNGGFDFGRSLGFASGYVYPPLMWALSAKLKF